MYKTIVVTPAAVEPVTLAEACIELKINVGDDDDLVELLISAARDKAETYCNRYFTEQTIKIVYEGGFMSSGINIPFPDVQSISGITYIDSENTQQTYSDGFTFFSDEQVIYPSDSFPVGAKGYTVTAVTGAPADIGSVKIAMLMLITDLYELRTESVIGFSVAKNPAVENMLWPHRVNLGV